MGMETEKNETGRSELIGKIVHYAGILTAVCLVSGAGLSLLYVASKQRIEDQAGKALAGTLDVVLGDAVNPEEIIPDTMWVAEKPGGGVRYAAKGTARGYQSDITVLASVDADSAEISVTEKAPLYRLAVLSSAETPGLGENINAVKRTVSLWAALIGKREEPGRPWFQTQFQGKTMRDLYLEEEDGGIKPVTGATETSTATAKAARNALQTIINETAHHERVK